MTCLDRHPVPAQVAQVVVLTAKHRLDRRFLTQGLLLEDVAVLKELRDMAAEARA